MVGGQASPFPSRRPVMTSMCRLSSVDGRWSDGAAYTQYYGVEEVLRSSVFTAISSSTAISCSTVLLLYSFPSSNFSAEIP